MRTEPLKKSKNPFRKNSNGSLTNKIKMILAMIIAFVSVFFFFFKILFF